MSSSELHVILRMTIGARLRAFRDHLGWTQPRMAEALKLSLRTYADLEAADRLPKTAAIHALLRMNVSPGWLITGAGPMLASDGGNQNAQALQTLHQEVLVESVRAVESLVSEWQGALSAEQKAKLIVAVYEDALERLEKGQGPVDASVVGRYLRLVKG